MADSDYNMIKPVEGLPNISGLTPARRREERKRRHNLRDEHKEESNEELSDVVDDENGAGQATSEENDRPSIDYCA